MGLKAPTLQYRERAGCIQPEFDFGRIADVTAHPYRLQCEQFKHQPASCTMKLAGMAGAEVLFSSEVTGVEEDTCGRHRGGDPGRRRHPALHRAVAWWAPTAARSRRPQAPWRSLSTGSRGRSGFWW